MKLEELKTLLESKKELQEFAPAVVPALPWLARLAAGARSAYAAKNALSKVPDTGLNGVDGGGGSGGGGGGGSGGSPDTPLKRANFAPVPKPVSNTSSTSTSSTPKADSATTPTATSEKTPKAPASPTTSNSSGPEKETKPLEVDVKKRPDKQPEQTFSQAFKAAREKAGNSTGRFTYKGKEYQTNRAGEKYVSKDKQKPVSEEAPKNPLIDSFLKLQDAKSDNPFAYVKKLANEGKDPYDTDKLGSEVSKDGKTVVSPTASKVSTPSVSSSDKAALTKKVKEVQKEEVELEEGKKKSPDGGDFDDVGDKEWAYPKQGQRPHEVVDISGKSHGPKAKVHLFHNMGPDKKTVAHTVGSTQTTDVYAYDHKPSHATIKKHWMAEEVQLTAEEIERIDELSKKTLRGYADKVIDKHYSTYDSLPKNKDGDGDHRKATPKQKKDLDRPYKKGYERAMSKLDVPGYKGRTKVSGTGKDPVRLEDVQLTPAELAHIESIMGKSE